MSDVLAATPLPKDYHVDIIRKPLTDAHGWAEALDIDTGRFRILIDDDLTAAHTAEILIHELAHVLDWRPTTAWSANHGPTFWIHVGEVWRNYYQVM